MKFFTELDGIIGTNTITITVTKSKDKLIVLTVPRGKDGDPIDDFVPLSISGSPEQLDAGYTIALSKSMDILAAMKSNLEDIEKAAAETKEEAAKTAKKKADRKTEKKEDKKVEAEPEPTKEPPLPWENVDTETGEVKDEPVTEEKSTTMNAIPEPKPVAPKAAEPKKAPETPVTTQQSLMSEPEAPKVEPTKTAEDDW
ncbi:MAG: PRTRC system protein E [Bacteroidales bacterium]|nr:PRTRC system protein E [Bacteroidales bacterium]